MHDKTEPQNHRFCVVIPVYNHGAAVETALDNLAHWRLPCICVNDGSDQPTTDTLRGIAGKYPWVRLIEFPHNLGKGAAVCAGFLSARAEGYSHAIQIDADGQHDAADLGKFMEASRRHPQALIAGEPVFDHSAPWVRVWGRRLSNYLCWIETLSTEIADVLCGFRVYPLEPCARLLERCKIAPRMDFDTEIAVRLSWLGVPGHSIRTKVSYPKDGISHFRMVADNARLILLHLRLLFETPWRQAAKWRRRKGDTRPWFALTERGSRFAFSLIITVYRLLGRRVCLVLLYPIIGYFFVTGRSARRASQAYLTQLSLVTSGSHGSVHESPWWRQFQHFMAFGRMVLDKVSVWAGDISMDNLEWANLEELKALAACRKGAFLVSAHIGNIEIVRAVSRNIPGVTVHALMFRKHVRVLERGLHGVNREVSGRIIPLEDISVETVGQLDSLIESGEFIAALADRVAPGAPSRTRKVHFLGRPAPFPEGPWILAGLLRCPVFLVFCLPERDGSYRVHFEKLSDGAALSGRQRNEAVDTYMQRYAEALEKCCCRAPLQWFNFYDFWAGL